MFIMTYIVENLQKEQSETKKIKFKK